jgi:hypothetical protein
MKEAETPPRPAVDKERQPNPPQKTMTRQPDKMVRGSGYKTK